MIRTLYLFLGGVIFGTPLFVSAQSRLDSFNVIWTTPGPGPAESMPLGNGDIGLNAWVEPGGDLLFYISKTDAWGDQVKPGMDGWMKQGGILSKLGLVRVSFGSGGSAATGFKQELRLREGEIRIKEGDVRLRLWVDANHPVVRVEMESGWIFVSGDPAAWETTRGYVLQRFVTACAGRGAYPIKFNGSIFVVSQPDPDYRGWGGMYWFQNTRPMYYTGDKDFAHEYLMPLASAGLQFFDEHFGRDTEGKDPRLKFEAFWVKGHDYEPDDLIVTPASRAGDVKILAYE